MTPDLQGIGVNGQALCVQLAANLEARQKAIPEVSDYIEAWMSCYENGLLVEVSSSQRSSNPNAARLQSSSRQKSSRRKSNFNASSADRMLETYRAKHAREGRTGC